MALRRLAMDGKKTKGSLHDRWTERTETAFRRMFSGKSRKELVTLTEREDLAVSLGKELTAFLLEEHVAADEAVSPAEASLACCPKCGQPGEPAPKEAKGGKELEGRTVTTRAGDVRMERERWKCEKCRIVFFSARRSSEAGHRGR